MTFDERLEFLFRSTESLHQSVQELTATVGQLAHERREDRDIIRALTAAVSADAENIRALARIAEAHERRISDIEG